MVPEQHFNDLIAVPCGQRNILSICTIGDPCPRPVPGHIPGDIHLIHTYGICSRYTDQLDTDRRCERIVLNGRFDREIHRVRHFSIQHHTAGHLSRLIERLITDLHANGLHPVTGDQTDRAVLRGIRDPFTDTITGHIAIDHHLVDLKVIICGHALQHDRRGRRIGRITDRGLYRIRQCTGSNIIETRHSGYLNAHIAFRITENGRNILCSIDACQHHRKRRVVGHPLLGIVIIKNITIDQHIKNTASIRCAQGQCHIERGRIR